MFPAPMVIRREAQQTGNDAEHFVRGARFEKGAMATIVKDDENADQETAGQQSERYREPNRDREAQKHQVPKRRIGNHRVDELPNRSPVGRLLVTRYDELPVWGGGFVLAGGIVLWVSV